MELKELIERVRAATGPDRELDAHLARMAGWNVVECKMPDINGSTVTIELWRPENCDDASFSEYVADIKAEVSANLWRDHDDFPAYTASIDAALALVERCLPGWVVSDLRQNSRHAGDPWGCELAIYYGSNPSKNRSSFSGYDFPTAPLAIILALLTALDQKEENK